MGLDLIHYWGPGIVHLSGQRRGTMPGFSVFEGELLAVPKGILAAQQKSSGALGSSGSRGARLPLGGYLLRFVGPLPVANGVP
jgi:hypothetical protein